MIGSNNNNNNNERSKKKDAETVSPSQSYDLWKNEQKKESRHEKEIAHEKKTKENKQTSTEIEEEKTGGNRKRPPRSIAVDCQNTLRPRFVPPERA